MGLALPESEALSGDGDNGGLDNGDVPDGRTEGDCWKWWLLDGLSCIKTRFEDS